MNVRRSALFAAIGVLVLCVATLLVAPGSAQQDMPRSINFGTHAVGTVFNAVGTALGKVASDRGPIRVVVQPFSGPPAWVPSMNRDGKPEVGIINATEIWQAYTGKITARPLPPGSPEIKPPYAANPNLRLLKVGTSLSLGVLVRADSPMQSLQDLKGKRLTWGFHAFPANILSGLATLSTAGVSIRDVVPVPVPEVVSGVRALMEGRVDGAVAAVGMGIVSEANARVGVRFLPAGQDAEGIRVAGGVMPGGGVTVRKAGPAGLKSDTPIWSYGISVVSSTHVSEQAAYTVLKTWAEHWKELEPIHPQLRGWRPEIWVPETATIPYHAGAIKFYKEKALWTAENDRRQEMLLKGELPFVK